MNKLQALLIVDVQNDFCSSGALAVPKGDEVVPVLNQYIELFVKAGCPIFASRDWHPAQSQHFKKYGGPWPVHCVQDTSGAAFHPQLRLPEDTGVISKGTALDQDGYSAFAGIDEQGKTFNEILKAQGIEQLFIGGLATDYCVKASCLDAARLGKKVYLLKDAVRGVNLNPNDSKQAVEDMQRQGVQLLSFDELVLNKILV